MQKGGHAHLSWVLLACPSSPVYLHGEQQCSFSFIRHLKKRTVILQGSKPASEMSHCGADPFLDFSVTDLPLSGLLQPENLENPPNVCCGPAFRVLVSLGWEGWTMGLWEALMQGQTLRLAQRCMLGSRHSLSLDIF